MKEGKCKQFRSISILMLVLLLSTSAAAAETVTIPMSMEIQPLALDFEITESISMTAESGSNNLTVDSLSVTSATTNTLDIMVSEIAVEQQGEWTLVPDTTDFSSEIDSKKFSLVTASHDFSTGSYSEKIIITPGASKTVDFSGHTGTFREEVSEQAANMIVTVEFAPGTCNFRIDLTRAGGSLTTFTAVEGMTWGEWIESEYDTVGFIPCVNGGCHILHPDNYVIFDSKGDYRVAVNSEIVSGYKYLLTDNYETPQ